MRSLANKFFVLLMSGLWLLNGCTLMDAIKTPAATTQKDAKDAPVMVPANYNAAIQAAKSGETDQAITLFKDISAKNPKFSNAHTNLGLLYLKNKKYQDAENEFRTAIELDDSDAVAYNHLGIIMRENGKFSEARDMYSKAINIKPEYALAYLNLGILQDLYLQELADALENYRKYQSLTNAADKQIDKWIIDLEKRTQPAPKEKDSP
jgi:Flp pilus assembly protein TadD